MKVSLDLGCFVLVRENREYLKMTILPNLDILFGNFDEMHALFGSDQSIDWSLRGLNCLSAVLKVPEGCSIYWNGEVVHYPIRVVSVVDTMGAGDLFVSGFSFWSDTENGRQKNVLLWQIDWGSSIVSIFLERNYLQSSGG